ncbi:methyltransferase, TIGR04325 family [Magnetospirillum sp. SS-4]|uniref:methyltransferase, TIGR04325 family n=1 Tax=Magnetospirillum sp. SS-4 TaxID=2681465 RepID=UPI00137F6342|nr:methyltransferase, TIGR04325 family [Magnetospirillum sp. SS-4]CAA7617538.1 conserved hypothetical protein [Magnetospirillum sp. SS-4]
MTTPFNIWDGIHADFAAAPARDAVTGGGDGGFEGAEWLGKMEALAGRSLDQLARAEAPLCRDYPLAVVAALVPETPGRPLTVVDFGGGMANGFAGLRTSLPKGRPLAFHCIENAAVCAIGRRMFAGVGELRFHEDLDDAPAVADIVHAGSSMQYIEDWKGMLARLLRFQPRYLVLSDLPAGDIPTFVSVQNYYDRGMRHWFWNLDEFLAELARQGCRLLYRTRYEGSYLGRHGPYPMDNFPPGYRLGHACNLILAT